LTEVILVINTGSSSIKFSVFNAVEKLNLLYHGEVNNLSEVKIFNADHSPILAEKITDSSNEAALQKVFSWLESLSSYKLIAAGHRIVHGGSFFTRPALINEDVIKKISSLISLAPLHEPYNLEAIQITKKYYPDLPQVACFDTTFHLSRERLAKLFAIPRALTNEGLIRYGFHGISYEYIASVMQQYIGLTAKQRVIVAHLGNGASLCAMYDGKSVATTMGLSALDGLVMGTRCGQIDPGVLLYLLQEKQISVKELEHILYKESGLLGVSGISHDVRELLASNTTQAEEAIDLFCYQAALEIGSLTSALNGCDALIFTAGIGENSAIIREKICSRLGWMGLRINSDKNKSHTDIISEHESKVIVSVIKTNEEYMIARHTHQLLKISSSH
jgi:acetate kinase